ncbi:CRISPR-associated helicase Cas3 [Ignisphaera aggregans DSM 17230]|uniref:CRISPR-associated helicase Cas3 n=1 Tax=Ignisphaera aggregans (strain DSM 17230 / JCM 13409 / AQ1.S1) TaxID=583356 RepID=E0STW6_IGNAA|nr:CRISPR-associated helicase Cas3 [Ignisphaera aggregans DSM 17230]
MDSMLDTTVEAFKVMISRRAGLDKEAVTPYRYQLEAFREFERLASGDLDVLIVRAPPARGKTEAPIASFLAQFVSGEILLPRIIYATPTQTLLYSMVRRFEGYLEALSSAYESFKSWREKLNPVAEHGLDVDPQYLIPRFTVSTYDVVAYAWTARRAIPWRPFTTRGALISSLVVFDEAHLVQDSYTYSQRVFVKLVETMARSGTPIVIMSATLPNKFVEDLSKGLDGDLVREVVDSGASIPGKISVSVVDDSAPTTDFERAMAEILNVANDAARSGKDVLLVFNTVRAAVKVYNVLATKLEKEAFTVVEVKDKDDVERALKDDGKGRIALLVLVHGRLPMGVRRRREELFESLRRIRSGMTEEGLEKRWSLIVVATQVAEVGLDYSFDYVVAELAPPSALVQRIMRAGRIRGQHSEALVLPPIAFECDIDSECTPPSFFVYAKSTLDLGREFVGEISKDPARVADVIYVADWVDREFKAIESETKEWAEILVNRAHQILDTSRFVPPFATVVHRRILESFKFRLGEYVALRILGEETSELEKVADIGEFERRLGELIAKPGEGLRELIEGSVRYALHFRKREIGGDKYTVAMLPRECVWTVGDEHVVTYVRSVRGGKVEIGFLVLKKLDESGRVYAAPGVEDICGRLLICKRVPGFEPEIGLVEVEEVELVVR